MGRGQVGRSKAEALGQGSAGLRANFRVQLCQAYAEVVERMEPEPRTVGKPRKEAAWLLSSAQAPFLGDAPAQVMEVPCHWRGWGKMEDVLELVKPPGSKSIFLSPRALLLRPQNLHVRQQINLKIELQL